MKTAEEWAREIDYTLSAVETIRQVRNEALEEAAKAIRKLDDGDFNHTTIRLHKAEEAIRQLKEQS